MNTSIILDKMRALKLSGMSVALEELIKQPEAQQLSFDEKLSIIIDRELIWRENAKQSRLLRYAKLRAQNSCVENIDYTHRRKLDKSKFITFTTCDWVRQQQNLVFTGPTGIGKTYLSCALGHQACRQGISVKYFRVPRLFEHFRVSQAEGRYSKFMQSIAKADLLILDDWGLGSLTKTERSDLLEMLEDRNGLKSTIITTQLPIESWPEYIGDATMADAIMDRVLSCAHKIDIDGPSMRRMDKKLAENDQKSV